MSDGCAHIWRLGSQTVCVLCGVSVHEALEEPVTGPLRCCICLSDGTGREECPLHSAEP